MAMLYSIFTFFASGATSCNPNKTFFGIPVWYKYLKPSYSNGMCQFPNFHFPGSLALIGLAVVDMLLRVAGLIAIGFIFYGAIGFITSQGNPEDAAKARGTAIDALVGLAITMVAIVFVQFVGKSLQ